MLENGAELRYIQAILGHADINTTTVYTHLCMSQLLHVHQQTHPVSAKIANYDYMTIRYSIMNVTATELKNRLGQYLEMAQREPVIIEKSGRESSVVLSKQRYDALCEMEDNFWDKQAQDAEKEGFMSAAETRTLLSQ